MGLLPEGIILLVVWEYVSGSAGSIGATERVVKSVALGSAPKNLWEDLDGAARKRPKTFILY